MKIEVLPALIEGGALEAVLSPLVSQSLPASATVTVALSATCTPSRTSTEAVAAKASASFFRAKVFSRRLPPWSV